MATLRTILELALRGGADTKRQLEQIGKSGDEAFKKIDTANKKIPAGLRATDAAAKDLRGRLESLGTRAGAAGTALQSLGPAGIAAAAGLGALGAAFLKVTREGAAFNAEIAELSAITGAVGDDLDFFRRRALDLGSTTTASAQEVASAFRLIASAKGDLLENAEALADVTEQVLLLSDASGLALPEASQAVTTALNQFSLASGEAARVVNVLAAGAKFGAAEIPDLTVALTTAGPAATAAGVSIEQLVAIIEVLSQFGTPIEIIGTSLRNIFLELITGADDVNPKLEGLQGALANLRPLLDDDQKLLELFDKRSSGVARQLIATAGSVELMTANVTDTAEAIDAASRRTDSLETDLKELQNAVSGLASEIAGTQEPIRALVQGMKDAAVFGRDATAAIREFSGVLGDLQSNRLALALLAGAGGTLVGGPAVGAGLAGAVLVMESFGDATAELAAAQDEADEAALKNARSVGQLVDLIEGRGSPLAQAFAKANGEVAVRVNEAAIAATTAADRYAHMSDVQQTAAQSAESSIESIQAEIRAREGAIAAGLTEAQTLIAIQAQKVLAETGSKQLALQYVAEANALLALKDAQAARVTIARDQSRATAAALRDEETARTRFHEALRDLQEETLQIGVDAEEQIRLERDITLRELLALADDAEASEEQLAAVRVAVNENAEKKISEVRKREADRRSREADREAERAAREQEREAERAAELLNRPFVNALENIQRGFGDLFTDILSEGEFTADTLADLFLDAFARLGGELLAAQVVQPLLNPLRGSLGLPVVGQQGRNGQPTGADLNAFTQAIGSFSHLIPGAFKNLGGALHAVGAGAATLGEAVGFFRQGISFREPLDALSADEIAITQPQSITNPRPGQESTFNTDIASGATSAIGTLGIALAIISAAEGIAGVDKVRRGRKALFDRDDAIKLGRGSAGGFNRAVGEIFPLEFLGVGTDKLFKGQTTFGNVAKAAALTIFTGGLGLALVANAQRPTKGTALRKSFEEFIEQEEFGLGNNFKRGLGQQGTRALLPDIRGGGPAFDGDFVLAQRQFIGNEAGALGLDDSELQQVTGLGVAFRAIVGKKAGNEEARSLGIVADFLATINLEGKSAAQTLEIVGGAIRGLGDPRDVFRELNEFFQSADNDINPDDFKDAIQGLATALFTDVPAGVDAAAIALDEFNTRGEVTFERLQRRVEDVAAAANLLTPAIGNVFNLALTDLDLTHDDLFQSFERDVALAVKDAVLEGFTQATLESSFSALFFEPITGGISSTLERLSSGEITTEEAGAELSAVLSDVSGTLQEFAPFLRDAIDAVRDFSDELDTVIPEPEVDPAVRRAQRDAFDKDIGRQILRIEDPVGAAVAATEDELRARVALAAQLGADLGEVERLFQLERQQIAERFTDDTLAQYQRAFDQARAAAERSLQGLQSTIDAFTASPSSPLATPTALSNAQRIFADLLSDARAGDLDAVDALPGAFQNVAALAQTMFGSSEAFFDIFNAGLADLESVIGIGPDRFARVSVGEQAIVDAIDVGNLTLADVLAELREEEGIVPEAGTVPGDDQATGRYGLNRGRQRLLQAQLEELTPGQSKGVVDILARIGGVESQGDIAGFLLEGGRERDFINQILELFPETRNPDGGVRVDVFNEVVEALSQKLLYPDKFQPILGFATGGLVQREMLARIGEGGAPEAVLPLEHPTAGRAVATFFLSALTQMHGGRSGPMPVALADPIQMHAPQQEALLAALGRAVDVNTSELSDRLERLERQQGAMVQALNTIAQQQRRSAFEPRPAGRIL